MAPRIAVIYYSTYGRNAQLARSVVRGIESAGGKAEIFQIEETLSTDILRRMHAPPRETDPVIKPEDLINFDAFIFGIPTRFGTPPAQWTAFWDKTGQLWVQGGLHGKYVGAFTSTGTLGGGQEATIHNSVSTFAHHGMLFVPLGYKEGFPLLTNLDEVHGGSPWGAGTVAGNDGSRKPSKLEIDIAEVQGSTFYKLVARSF